MKYRIKEVLALGLWIFFIFASPSSWGDTISVNHRWGTTAFETNPERIVSLSYTGIDALLALGVTPISYRAWFGGNDQGLWPWTLNSLPKDASFKVLRGEINPEEVARLRPDFVEALYSGISPAQYAALSRVTPVLPAPKDQGDFSTAWDVMLRQIGRAIARQDQADKVIQDIEATFAKIRARHPEWVGKTAIVAQPEGPLIFSETDPRMALLTRLGFKIPNAARPYALGNFYFKLDRELTEPLDADVILWVNFHHDFSALDIMPLRHTLKAVQEGREVFLDPVLSAALSYSSPLSIPYLLDRLEPLLEKALSTSSAPQTSEEQQ